MTALRWAALKAGLGIIRKNNFFYSDSGSWVYLEAWLIDQELTLKENTNLKNCPPNCNLCIKACRTNSLSEPYMMNRSTCISCLTTGKDGIYRMKNIINQWEIGFLDVMFAKMFAL